MVKAMWVDAPECGSGYVKPAPEKTLTLSIDTHEERSRIVAIIRNRMESYLRSIEFHRSDTELGHIDVLHAMSAAELAHVLAEINGLPSKGFPHAS